MKNLLAILLTGFIGWKGYQHFYQPLAAAPTLHASEAAAAPQRVLAEPAPSTPFSCDGRQRCSQMTSCAEAKYFLANCPGVKMDGDGDGVPCERQHCTAGG